jgi:GTPase SAR1 family protein
MYRASDSTSKPELKVVSARSHLITKSRSHLAYSNHALSPLYQLRTDEEHNEFDCSIKIAVIGKQSIGKTSFIYRIFNNSTLYTTYIPTTGIHTLHMYRGFSDPCVLPESAVRPLSLHLSLVDYGFRDNVNDPIQSLANEYKYFDGVLAIILCYAIDDRESFLVLTKWIRQIYQFTSERGVAIVLTGLRTDADRPYLTDAQKKLQRYQGWRTVSTMEAYQFALLHRIPYLECTAAMGWFCDDVLATAIHHVLRRNCIPSNPLGIPRLFLPKYIVAQMPREVVDTTASDAANCNIQKRDYTNSNENCVRPDEEQVNAEEHPNFASF